MTRTTENRRPKTENAVRRSLCATVLGFALALFAAPLGAQGVPPKPKPDSVPPKRRALEIRGQAPAPEVVTVRPREIPVFPRRIISAMLSDSVAVRRPRAPAIILPGVPTQTPSKPE